MQPDDSLRGVRVVAAAGAFDKMMATGRRFALVISINRQTGQYNIGNTVEPDGEALDIDDAVTRLIAMYQEQSGQPWEGIVITREATD
ncbi:MAG: hypothetical protein ABI725_01210 [Chloroflexota bacterium]